MKINVGKTKCLEGTTSDEGSEESVMDGETIESVDRIKYLGILIDRKLSFKENCEQVCKKVARKLVSWSGFRSI